MLTHSMRRSKHAASTFLFNFSLPSASGNANMSRSPVCRCVLLALLALVAALVGRRKVPVTRRSQILMMPESQEIALGVTAYEEILHSEPKSTNQEYIDLVNRFGKRIASDVTNAFAQPAAKSPSTRGSCPSARTKPDLP